MSYSPTFHRERGETPEDRAAELVIAERFRDETGAIKLDRMPRMCRMDYLATWHTGAAWLEVKRCGKSAGGLPNYWLDVEKWAAGIEWARNTGASFILAVSFADGDRAYVYNDDDVRCRRVRPVANADGEPCVAIPLARFQRGFARIGTSLYGTRATVAG